MKCSPPDSWSKLRFSLPEHGIVSDLESKRKFFWCNEIWVVNIYENVTAFEKQPFQKIRWILENLTENFLLGTNEGEISRFPDTKTFIISWLGLSSKISAFPTTHMMTRVNKHQIPRRKWDKKARKNKKTFQMAFQAKLFFFSFFHSSIVFILWSCVELHFILLFLALDVVCWEEYFFSWKRESHSK